MFEVLILAAALAAPQHLPTVTVQAPKAALTLQVARTEEQRETGLMNVRSLEPHTGMVFVFDEDAPVEFWMKDTLIPLDMVFVGTDGAVRDVFENVPATTPSTPDAKIPRRDGKARYVIELRAFEAAKDGIQTGTVLPWITTLTELLEPAPSTHVNRTCVSPAAIRASAARTELYGLWRRTSSNA